MYKMHMAVVILDVVTLKLSTTIAMNRKTNMPGFISGNSAGGFRTKYQPRMVRNPDSLSNNSVMMQMRMPWVTHGSPCNALLFDSSGNVWGSLFGGTYDDTSGKCCESVPGGQHCIDCENAGTLCYKSASLPVVVHRRQTSEL